MRRADRIRLVVFPTAFGALWGLIELLAGGWLHAMRVPVAGAFLGSAGGIILCAERAFTPVRGATLCTGLTAILVKLMFIGGLQFNIVIALALETAVAEAVLTVFGVSALSFFLAPLLCCMESSLHFLIGNWLKYGGDIFGAYAIALRKIAALFGIKPDFWKLAVALWAGLHLAIGGAAGLVSVRVGRYLRKI
ncbi:MAG: hypothetical protein WC421_02205 [Elusimicrobiales bacterium]